MNVDEWLHIFYMLTEVGGSMDIGDDDVPVIVTYDDVRKGICEEVIKEMSEGIIDIEQHEGYLSPEPMFTVGTKSKLKAGTFHIIPVKHS